MPRRSLVALVLLALSLTGCQKAEPPPRTRIQGATVQLFPLEGRTARGIIDFEPTGGGLELQGEMTGLRGRNHEYRVHRLGDCTDARGRSAGEPFAFTDPVSGRDVDGTMVSTENDETGEVSLAGRFRGGRLSGPLTVIGRSVVVHRLDRATDGSLVDTRIACGVIGIAREGTD